MQGLCSNSLLKKQPTADATACVASAAGIVRGGDEEL